MTQQEINNIIYDYEKGLTLDGLIKKYHHCHQTIRKILTENNIAIRSQGKKGQEKIILSKEIEQKIIKNYNSGMGLKASGDEFGISSYKVKTILLKYNIYCRNQSESASIQNILRKKYFCNENFFKTQNSDMAYILGFLAADGTVRKDCNEIKITVAQKDKDILEKIKEKLEFTGPIRYATTSKGFDIATLAITCQEYKKDLAEYNIIPLKTFTFSMPEKLDRKYWIDFIRGYWDGDGTICTAGKNVIKSSLCSAHKITLEQILNFLEEYYGIPQVNIQSRKGKNPLFYFQYSINSTKKLHKALYYDDNVICLQRKKDKFNELCIDNKNPRDSAS